MNAPLPASATPLPEDAHAFYGTRRAAFEQQETEATRREDRLGSLRLVIVGLACVLAWLIYRNDWSVWWLLVPALAFVLAITQHMRVQSLRLRASRGKRFYELGLERLQDDWRGHQPDGAGYLEPTHLFAPDLDLFGPGSMFQRLCMARMQAGQDRLAKWLGRPAESSLVARRQEAVLDLKSRPQLREDAALLGDDTPHAGKAGSLRAWLADDTTIPARGMRPLLVLSSMVTTGSLVGWLTGSLSPLWFMGAALVQYALCRPIAAAVEKTIVDAMGPAKDLGLLGRLMERLRSEDYDASLLREIATSSNDRDVHPRAVLHGMERRAAYVESRANPFFMVFAWLGCLGTHLGFSIETWRKRHGATVLEWVEHCARFEALTSLATWAFERPDAHMPTLVEGSSRFSATLLGHPLIDPNVCVTNSVALEQPSGDAPSGLIVSGSNMSGKSTLLRSVGCNVVLAQMGAPVCASSMTLSPLSLAASITVQDSLMKGASRFYAEIERLKAVVDTSRDAPSENRTALFLIDEVLHGTNSHDRRIGTRGIIRSLLGNGSLGLITTHDLALSALADESANRLHNVHFIDHIEDGRIAFDYKLRQGVVTRSNALELMKSVGIDVDDTLEAASDHLRTESN